MSRSPLSRTFRAALGERSFDVRLEGDTLYVDDEPLTHTFERVDEGYYVLRLEGDTYPVVVEEEAGGALRVTLRNRTSTVRVQDETDLLLERFGLADEAGAGERAIRAPMPGLVLRLMVEPGQEVAAGEGLLVLEAMKMENELRAPADGVVETIHMAEGDAVGKNDLLIELEA